MSEKKPEELRPDPNLAHTLASLAGETLLPTGEQVRALEPEPEPRTAAALEVTPEAPGRYSPGGPELGRGGIGRVTLAADAHLGRQVAIKQLLGTASRAHTAAATAREARFLREARVTGSLEHPNIVPVHELGVRADGSLYYTMKVVRGHTLRQALDGTTTLSQRLRLLPHVVDLCQAVAYAHSRGVVHRDIKPDNVMLGEYGETVVVDWGLAKVKGLEDLRGSELENRVSRLMDTGHTVSGRVLGTPHYMSPEAAAGQVEAIDERSDVWSLGVVLYELLADQVPFEGTAFPDLFKRIRTDSIPPVPQVCPEAPADLAAVCHKALQQDPAQRYQTADQVAQDIQRWLTGDRVTAYDYGSLELLARFARKQRVPLVVAGVGIGALLGLGLMSWRQVVAEHDLALEHLAESQLEASEAALSRGDHVRARALLRHSLELDDSVRGRALLGRLERDPLVWSRSFLTKAHALDFSPDGRWLAVADDSRLLTLVDTLTSTEETPRFAGKLLMAVRFSPDGQLLAGVGYDGTVQLYPALEGEPRSLEGATGRVSGVGWAPDGSWLVVGDQQALLVYDTASGEVRARHPVEGGVSQVDVAPAGWVAAAGPQGEVWRLDGGELTRLGAHDGPVGGLAISSEGVLATASYDGEVRLWEGDTWTPVEAPPQPVSQLDWSPDGVLAGGASHGPVILWEQGRIQGTLRQPGQAQARTVVFDPASGHLAVGARDRVVEVFDLQVHPLARRGHPDGATSVVLDPGSGLLWTGGPDPDLRAWRAEDGLQVATLTGHESNVLSLALSSRGQLASGSRDGTLRLWDPHTGTLDRLFHHGTAVHAVDFSPDGSLVVGGDFSGQARVWEVDTGSLVATLDHDGTMVYQARFDPRGRLLTSAGNHIRWFSPPDFALERSLEAPLGFVDALVPGPGDELMVGHWGEGVLLYRGDEVESVDFPSVLSGAFSPDGRSLVMTGHGAVLRELDTGAQRVLFPEAYSKGVAWSEDGQRVYLGGQHLTAWTVTGQPTWGGWYQVTRPGQGRCVRAGLRELELQDQAGATLDSYTLEHTLGFYDKGYPPYPEHMALLPMAGGCLSMCAGTVRLHRPDHSDSVISEGLPGMIFPWGEGAGVLVGEEILRLDDTGAEVERRALPGPASSVFSTSLGLVAGMDDRTLLVLDDQGESHLMDAPLDVLTLAVDGPGGTLLLGTMAGDVLLISPQEGILDRTHLNGIVQELILEGDTARVRTSAGDSLDWDLSVLARPRCELLRRVWDDVPLVVEGSRVVHGAPPQDHVCAP